MTYYVNYELLTFTRESWQQIVNIALPAHGGQTFIILLSRLSNIIYICAFNRSRKATLSVFKAIN